jgi:adenylate kinase
VQQVILLGLPGAGKGTQAQRLQSATGLLHISSGDLFRENMSKGTELGKKAEQYVNSGALVPDEITIGMILERIARPDVSKGLMLDGFPRTIHQANALDEALRERGLSIDRAIYMKVSPEELVRRLAGRWSCPKCGTVYNELKQPPAQAGVCDNCGSALTQREDDKPEVVSKRIGLQMKNLEPLLLHYDKQGKLLEVNGERDADEVTRDLQRLIGRAEQN